MLNFTPFDYFISNEMNTTLIKGLQVTVKQWAHLNPNNKCNCNEMFSFNDQLNNQKTNDAIELTTLPNIG